MLKTFFIPSLVTLIGLYIFYLVPLNSARVEILYTNIQPKQSTISQTFLNYRFSSLPDACTDLKLNLNINKSFPKIRGHIYQFDDSEKKYDVSSELLYLNKASYFLYRLRNIYYRSQYTYVLGKIGYGYDSLLSTIPGKVCYHVGTLVVLNGANSHSFFGDMVLGGLIRIAHMPSCVLDGATFTYPNLEFRQFYEEILNIFDVKNFKLLYVPPKFYVFASELFTVIPIWEKQRRVDFVHMGFMYIIKDFVGKIEEKYNTSNIVPTEYGIMQREEGMSRYCNNFVDIYSTITKEHPNISFKIIPHCFMSFIEATKTLRKMKWLFGPTGSNMVFPIFMCPGTTVCMYMADWFDSPIISVFIAIDINFIGFMHNVGHFSNTPITLKIDRTSYYVNLSLATLSP